LQNETTLGSLSELVSPLERAVHHFLNGPSYNNALKKLKTLSWAYPKVSWGSGGIQKPNPK
ncbi:hypothetical protein U1Q18_051257, partial [Sarracenia purpurea var. burkii]